MDFEQVARKFNCPYCLERITMLLDPTIDKQQYVEDCEVCCNPIEITCTFSNGELVYFDAKASD